MFFVSELVLFLITNECKHGKPYDFHFEIIDDLT